MHRETRNTTKFAEKLKYKRKRRLLKLAGEKVHYITASPGIQCNGSCHSCYMLGPATQLLPCTVRCWIFDSLSGEIYKGDGHFVFRFHLVVEWTNYQNFRYCFLPLMLYRQEIRTSSPVLRLPATKDNTFKHNHSHGTPECMHSVYFRKLGLGSDRRRVESEMRYCRNSPLTICTQIFTLKMATETFAETSRKKVKQSTRLEKS